MRTKPRRTDRTQLIATLESDLSKVSLSIQYMDRKDRVTTRVVTPLVVLRPSSERRCSPDTLIVWCHERDDLWTLFVPSIINADPVKRREVDVARVVLAVAKLPSFTRRRLKETVL